MDTEYESQATDYVYQSLNSLPISSDGRALHAALMIELGESQTDPRASLLGGD